jgi:tetratricopeptide (TPR) repeat protein
MRNDMKRIFCLFLLLLWIPLLASAAMPTKADVIRVVNQHFIAVDKEISTAQKTNIFSFVDTFPAADSGCPGFLFKKTQTHVLTTSKAGAFFQTGFEAVIKGKFKEAEWCYLHALRINSDCPVYLSNAAFTFNIFGEYEDALVLLNYAIGRDPTFASAWINIGYASKNLKKIEAAKKAYQMAIGLNPEIEDYKQLLKDVYESEPEKKATEQDKTDAALNMLNNILKMAKDTAQKSEKSGQTGGKTEANPKPKEDAGPTGESAKQEATKMGSDFNSDMKILAQFVPGLAAGAAAFLREAEWHGQKAQQEHGTLKAEHKYAETGYTLLAFLLQGYIADMTGSWDKADESVARAFARSPKRPKDYNPIEGLGGPGTQFPPISVGIDAVSFTINPKNQEIEMEIGEGLIFGVSMSEHGWGVKVGVGVMAEAGPFGGEAAYFWKYDSIKGFLEEGKVTGTFGGVKVGLPVYEQHLWGFENIGH